MSDFCLNTNFQVGDQIKIVFNIYTNAPSGSGKTVYIVDLFEGQDIESNPGATLYPYSDATGLIGTCNTIDGESHTNDIINQTGHTFSAAKFVADTTRVVGGVTYDDWYLPAANQLTTMYQVRNILDPVILENGGDKLTKTSIIYNHMAYWSSTESTAPGNPNPVFTVSFNPLYAGGALFGRAKQLKFRTRGVRKEEVSPSSNLSVGDFYGGGVIYRIQEVESELPTPTIDADVTIAGQNIFSQNNLANNSIYEIEHTITESNGSSPQICWTYTNNTVAPNPWITTVSIFKGENEIIDVIQPGQKTTLAWNDDAKRWTSRYSFIPEYMSTHKTGIATFLNGDIYIHDDYVNKNYFYGGSYNTTVTYIENVSPSQPKVFQTHAVEGNTKPNYTTLETVDNWVMNSDLVRDDYISREGTFYTELFGDVNDPNVGDNASYGDKLRRGTKLRGQYIKVGMTFTDNELEVKHSNIGYITSKGHTT